MAILGLLLTLPAAHAEDLSSLDEAIAQALAHSPEVAMAEARVSHAEAQRRSAHWGWFHPEVRVFAGESATSGATRAGIQVSQDVMRLVTLNHDEVRQADHELALARQELILTTQRVVHQVYETRTQRERLHHLVTVKAQAVVEHEHLLALAQTQFDAGAVSLERLLAAKQALAHAQQEWLQAQGELRLAQVTRAQLLGDPLPSEKASP